MKITKPVDQIFSRFRDVFLNDRGAEFTEESILRSELYSSTQMKAHGLRIANAHVLLKGKQPDKLLKELDENEEIIYEVHDVLIDAIKAKRPIAPASEWFLDNFYLIKEQIALARKHLPKGYSQTLPILAKGQLAGFPRVYDLALEIISHSDGRVDLTNIAAFIKSYQSKSKLTLGELWAIPIMLRLALIEDINRIGSGIAIDRLNKNDAIYWSEQLMAIAQSKPKNLILVMAEMAKAKITYNSAFVAEFDRQLQGKGQGLGMALTWVDEQLLETGHTLVELVNMDNQKQAADQVSIRNCIESIRLIRTTDWRDFVESISEVEKILSEDIGGVYKNMDFATRDRYRHVVEWIGKNATLEEYEIARLAISLAKEAAASNMPERQHHVGYFLVDRYGQPKLIDKAGMTYTTAQKLKNFLRKHTLIYYTGSALYASYIIALLAFFYTWDNNKPLWLAFTAGLLCFVAFSQLAIVLINWLSTIIVKPRPLAKMNFAAGIPKENAALIAVPSMLTSISGIHELVEELQVRYLANSEDNLYFSLVTDFADAPNETMPNDDELLDYAAEAIHELNLRYSKEEEPDKFYLFHRPRKWNPSEKVWMGKERKRGKLGELNSLLRNTNHHQFLRIVGNVDDIKHVKYIISLDADTQLPREAGWKLIAAMAHPINRPVVNERMNRVIEGYGILQPRTGVSLPKTDSSIYTRMHSNDAGLDPYTQLVSDVYQDLFGEGSFVGKGIYDIDVFEKVLGDTFPENRILSHDLLEGSYVRSGLLTDVQFFEDYPGSFATDMSRRHRWIRGDWQIASWILPWVPNKFNKRTKNFISSISKWKIADNLRRSIALPSLLALMVLAWTLLPNPFLWTLCFLAIWFTMPLISAIWHFFHKSNEVSYSTHIHDVLSGLKTSMKSVVLNITMLPFEAYTNADALVRANWRMFISKRHMLEWMPSSSKKSQKDKTIPGAFRYMWFSPFIAIVIGAFAIYNDPAALPFATPFLLLWIIAPLVAWYISKPYVHKVAALSHKDSIFLHAVARKTWAYFEEFTTEQDNFLPPDNYQETPVIAIAHRTSPTNIGFAALASLSAYDFGYITLNTLINRTKALFDTLNKLERYRGHLYNWYDTISLVPLNPRYISMVDSGNFVSSIITLKEGLKEIVNAPVFSFRFIDGFKDTLRVAKEHIKSPEHFTGLDAHINDITENDFASLSSAKNVLYGLKDEIEKLAAELHIADEPIALSWLHKLQMQIAAALDDMELLMPWAKQLPAPATFATLEKIDTIGSIKSIYDNSANIIEIVNNLVTDSNIADADKQWLTALKINIQAGSNHALKKLSTVEKLINECEGFATVEYDFLYDKAKYLFHIGYNATDDVKDRSYYDMLASEARLAIFTAIAQGKVGQSAWFALGRLVTNSNNAPTLLSWSGSMFEYLMPQLLMPAYENTLIERSNIGVIINQMEYGRKNNVPWGVSESGFNLVDTSLNYQYQAFGIPGLGLKRGLGDELVIAPYATMLAVMVNPVAAAENLKLLTEKGFEGRYGFYEAIDYTKSRVPKDQSYAIVKSFMVHHQAMGFLALAYTLLDQKMQRRFERDPQYQSALLLLQERAPRATNFYAHTEDPNDRQSIAHESQMRYVNTPNTPLPEIQILSNGKYQVVISNAGGSFSRWKQIALTRWREDMTRDNWGLFCYIKDLSTGNYWSNTYQPTLKKADSYETIFSQGHVEFKRTDKDFETRTDVVVSPEDDVELRRIKIINRSSATKTIEVTSYGEVVIADQPADEAHPAFSNLFVETLIDEDNCAILCTRRPRKRNETPPWMFHMVTLSGVKAEEITYETDRMKFIGRTRSVNAPAALQKDAALSGADGPILDPIVAIRYKLTLKPKQSATLDLIMGIGESREVVDALMDKYQDKHLKNRAFELAWTHSQVLLRQINANEAEAQLFNNIAGSIIYANANFRADPAIISSNFKGQSGLWGYAISGDLPIVLVRVQDSDNVDLVKQLIKAHSYWRLKGLAVDLVIWNDDFGTYRQLLHDEIIGFVQATGGSVMDQPGGVFLRSGDQISNEDRILFQTVARLIFDDNSGSLIDQMNRRRQFKALPAALAPAAIRYEIDTQQKVSLPNNLLFYNGTGGFTVDGKEYILLVTKDKTSPAPWVNVIANESIGTVISESGAAYTWSENAHAFRLTPWMNDPVSDKTGEAFYLRDEESGNIWSPSPLPAPSGLPYVVRHGFGYSVHEHFYDGLHSEMWSFVDKELPVKYIVLKVRNQSGRARRVSATGYVEWVLGDLAHKNKMFVVTDKDPVTGVLFARNRYNTTFGDKICFFDADGGAATFTCSRVEFIGRNGSLEKPEALLRKDLSGRIGAALDPCTAIQIPLVLEDGEEKEVIFRLGTGKNELETRELVTKTKGAEFAHEAQSQIHDHWNKLLGAVYVKTPDDALNHIANGWLVYQTLASRIWGRSGFYQSGGAFGFRDQLQDVLALMHTAPEISRSQILLAASRQFKEGDVQHWWHPPSGRGVRTTCSDDYLWLPFVTARYIHATGDLKILDEYVSFIEGRKLNPDEESYYDLPVFMNHWETLHNHCKYAIRFGLKFGVHGLPLIGSGDWNDGMDKVGEHGKGESVWLAFFLYDVLIHYAQIAEMFNDDAFAQECRSAAQTLKENIDKNAWDGDWYRRAYFDDGTPLGSKQNEECRIDSISQSWSVLSNGGANDKIGPAMESLNKYLVDRKYGIIKLLDPAFDKGSLYPGYIKGYVPGVRENGGQYTHAAVWAMMGFAKMQQKDLVWELFSMVNPVNHAKDEAAVQQYKVEPYVMAADVYGVAPHEGRGGWTWYTGSAGWTYQFVLEYILGLKRTHNNITFNPCIPDSWPGFEINYRVGENTFYHFVVKNEKTGTQKYIADGATLNENIVELVDDNTRHTVEIFL